ncbi:hypothetical protein B566_EDAN002859 [Ephemera danica]|nr:hypothetical protein B566_EDAN002859 [Ephemera danica]
MSMPRLHIFPFQLCKPRSCCNGGPSSDTRSFNHHIIMQFMRGSGNINNTSMNNMRMKLGGLPGPPPLPPMLMDAGSSTTEKPNIGMNIMDEKRLNMRGPLDFATQIAMVDPPMTLVDPMPTFPSLNLGMTAPHDEMQPPMARPMPFPGSPQFPIPAWQDDDDDDDCPFQNLGSMLPMFFPEFMHIGRVFNPVFGAPRLTSFFFRGPMFSSLLAPLMLAPSFGFGMGHGGRGHGGRGHGMRTTYNPRYHKSSEESDEHSDLDDDYKSPFDDSEEEEDPEEEDSYDKEDDMEEAEEEDEGNIAMDKNKYNGRKKQGQNGENMKPNLHAGKFLSPGKAKYSAPETCQSFSFSSSDMCCEMPERPLISKKMSGKCGDASNMRFLTKYLMNKFQNGNERLVFDKNSANRLSRIISR